jgi:hypothetical protein
MNAAMQLKKLPNKIADTIVDLVNATDGPVTLLQVEREITGFKSDKQPAWHFAFHRNGDGFAWGGMTEAGVSALCEVIYGKKVAVQFVTPQPYLLDGPTPYLDHRNWQPIMLLPASGANINNHKFLARLSPQCLENTLAGPPSDKTARFRLLTPRPLRSAADYFSVGDPRNRFSALLIRQSPPGSYSR